MDNQIFSETQKKEIIDNFKKQKEKIITKIHNNEFIKFGSMSSFVFDQFSSSEKYCFCNSDYWCNKCYGEL